VPATKCNECGFAHKGGRRFRSWCVYHDPDNYVDKRLADHQGLPEDCPGCLGHGTMEQKPFGRGNGDFLLTCKACKMQCFMSLPRRK
jgi:hypothetical protein